ncbi:MAG TPA: hypothetical protein VLB01_05470, partial [Thermodesulfobacteriota bacterium]|nr:hypothetical protein [Thermodesulfobacteriota bacterium]
KEQVNTLIRQNLLVIDDDNFKIQAVKMIFSRLGYDNIDIVGEEEEGLNMMEEKTYHLVLVSSRLLKDKVKFYERISKLERGLTQKVSLI